MVLWGFKTEATFDVWSIEHLMMGISLASFSFMLIKKWNKKEEIPAPLQLKISFLLVLVMALFWEALEHYIELGLLGSKIGYWFQGVEHWSNRLISDNLMVMSGWLIYTKKNKIVWFARIFSFIWLFFHIIIFPHSMYLHTLFNSGIK
jgi:hypothetical protein